jgi:hypothetical protein
MRRRLTSYNTTCCCAVTSCSHTLSTAACCIVLHSGALCATKGYERCFLCVGVHHLARKQHRTNNDMTNTIQTINDVHSDSRIIVSGTPLWSEMKPDAVIDRIITMLRFVRINRMIDGTQATNFKRALLLAYRGSPASHLQQLQPVKAKSEKVETRDAPDMVMADGEVAEYATPPTPPLNAADTAQPVVTLSDADRARTRHAHATMLALLRALVVRHNSDAVRAQIRLDFVEHLHEIKFKNHEQAAYNMHLMHIIGMCLCWTLV